jgi:hypothetical protein
MDAVFALEFFLLLGIQVSHTCNSLWSCTENHWVPLSSLMDFICRAIGSLRG